MVDFGLLTLFAAGFGTFFTPCVLPLIPIYLSILLGTQKDGDGRLRSLLPAFSFILGFSLVFVLLGLGASSIGALLAQHKVIFTLIAALLVFLFGLKFLGVIHIGFLERDTRYSGDFKKSRFQSINAFLMGFFFAFGWTPCVGPILGSVLSWTAVSANSPIQGALYLAMFSAGFAVPMLLAALFTQKTQILFNKIKPRLPIIEKGLGVIMILLALTIAMDTIGPLASSKTKEVAQNDKPAIEEQVANESKLPTMIEFYTPNCYACKMVEPTIEKLKKSCEGQHVRIVQSDINDMENFKTALKYGVRATPTFVFLDESGNEVSRLLGAHTEESFKQYLSKLTDGRCS